MLPQLIQYPVPTKSTCLDQNHTHFLLVDSGLDGKFGGEIRFRAAFEKALTEYYKCPTVLIVIQGSSCVMIVLIAHAVCRGHLWLCNQAGQGQSTRR